MVFYVLPFYVQQYLTLTLLDSFIAFKDIWLLHMLSFAVQTGFPHEKIVVYIACTKIWFPHILPFCVEEATCPFEATWWPHYLQWYFTPLYIALLWIARLSLLCEISCHKDVWIHHVQSSYDLPNYFFVTLEDHKYHNVLFLLFMEIIANDFYHSVRYQPCEGFYLYVHPGSYKLWWN